MRRALVSRLTLVAVLAMSTTVAADSQPRLTGYVSGLELCPQSLCGAAVFAGRFVGLVDGRLTLGAFWGAINHEPLPAAYETAAIAGGHWLIWTRRGTYEGVVPLGTITNNGDNTFTVALTMLFTDGGAGTVTFLGRLDHNVFPPTVLGAIAQ